jgi:pimeloyl-ACP methyl ester carboxylesterase
MADYASDVHLLAAQLPSPPVVMGWSLGGLVALMVAATGGASACVALAPSAPSRTRDPKAKLRDGEEQEMAIASLCGDSRYARDDRQAGIVIEQMPCPLLIVTGSADRQWPLERYKDLWLPADFVSAEGASHWGLVLNRRVLGQLVPVVTNLLRAQA